MDLERRRLVSALTTAYRELHRRSPTRTMVTRWSLCSPAVLARLVSEHEAELYGPEPEPKADEPTKPRLGMHERPPWDRFEGPETTLTACAPGLSLSDVATLRAAYRARHGSWPAPAQVGVWLETVTAEDVAARAVAIAWSPDTASE